MKENNNNDKQDVPKQRKNSTNNQGKNGRSHIKNRMGEGQFGSKILEQKDHNKKAEWINMETELRILEGPRVNIHSDGLNVTLKKKTNWKTPGLDGIREMKEKFLKTVS